MKALEEQMKIQEEQMKSLVKRLQKVAGRGGGVAAAADLSIDDADSEQRRKKQEWTPLRSGAKLSVKERAEDDEEWEIYYSEEHGSVYFWNKLTRTTGWKKE